MKHLFNHTSPQAQTSLATVAPFISVFVFHTRCLAFRCNSNFQLHIIFVQPSNPFKVIYFGNYYVATDEHQSDMISCNPIAPKNSFLVFILQHSEFGTVKEHRSQGLILIAVEECSSCLLFAYWLEIMGAPFECFVSFLAEWSVMLAPFTWKKKLVDTAAPSAHNPKNDCNRRFTHVCKLIFC